MSKPAPRKPSEGQLGLLSQAHEDTGWRAPQVLPRLSDVKRFAVDFETDSNDPHKARSVGMCLGLPEGNSIRGVYLPYRHIGGGNLDFNQVIRWANDNFRGKEIDFNEAKFDIRVGKRDGIDFEKLGVRPHENQYKAALLEDNRRSFSLDDLARDELGVEKLAIDHARIWEMPANQVGPYGERDGYLTAALAASYAPKIEKEGLQDVADLEDDLLYAVICMEDTGARLNKDKLRRWIRESEQELLHIMQELSRHLGWKCNPNSGVDMERAFNQLGLEHNGSFTHDVLKGAKHPAISLAMRARSVSSIRSKYLLKYYRAIGDGDILRYKLHQLKASNDEGANDPFGTISGRFSSSSVNIQQVYAPSRQKKKLGTDSWLIRELFIPNEGQFWLKADASQIEFRLMVHYSGSQRLLQEYIKDPYIDFHDKVTELLQTKNPDVTRDHGKGINFGLIYCMGRDKLARQLGVPRSKSDELYDQYNSMFPEVRKLIYRAIDLAENRGYVKTILGRKARFKTPDGTIINDAFHSSLNRVIQGTAADIMKRKILRAYRERVTLGITAFRFTVHDELDVDVDSPDRKKGVQEMLDSSEFDKIKVPLVWDVKVGPNWAMREAA